MTSRTFDWRSANLKRRLMREIANGNTADYFGRRPKSAIYLEDPFREPAPMPEPAKYRQKPPE